MLEVSACELLTEMLGAGSEPEDLGESFSLVVVGNWIESETGGGTPSAVTVTEEEFIE